MGEGRLARANELRRRAETHLASAGWLTARELLDDALALYRAEENRAGELSCLRGLGDVGVKLKELETAERMYGLVLEIAGASGDRLTVAEALYRRGDMERTLGTLDRARDWLRQGADVFREVGHRSGEAQCLGLLGEVLREQGGEPAEVIRLYRRAHALQMEAGDLRGASVTLTFLANALKERDPAAAAEAYVQAAHILEGLGLAHRADPLLAAARRLDPANAPPPAARPPGPWDSDE